MAGTPETQISRFSARKFPDFPRSDMKGQKMATHMANIAEWEITSSNILKLLIVIISKKLFTLVYIQLLVGGLTWWFTL